MAADLQRCAQWLMGEKPPSPVVQLWERSPETQEPCAPLISQGDLAAPVAFPASWSSQLRWPRGCGVTSALTGHALLSAGPYPVSPRPEGIAVKSGSHFQSLPVAETFTERSWLFQCLCVCTCVCARVHVYVCVCACACVCTWTGAWISPGSLFCCSVTVRRAVLWAGSSLLYRQR